MIIENLCNYSLQALIFYILKIKQYYLRLLADDSTKSIQFLVICEIP